MSGVPKRSHEEGVAHSSSSSSKYPHEDSGSYPKLTSVAPLPAQPHQQHHHQPHPQTQPQPHHFQRTNPFSHPHAPFELDSRMAKGPRIDPRDVERRSPLHSMYRMPSNDALLAHVPVLEPRETKDGRDIRVESRENRNEVREMYGEAKRDSQVPKVERDLKFENRAGDNGGNGNSNSNSNNNVRDLKFDRENYNDQKMETKVEKDGHVPLNWKEQKDYHRGKRFAEGSSGNVDPWLASRGNMQGPNEVGGKESAGSEEGAYLEGHETVGENKVDLKSDDRFKEKDKKRKDLRHREWGDREKERNDRRGCMPVSGVMGESKEIVREEREPDRWERERKDQERLKEREKDHIKRESWNGAEKEGLQNEKDLGEASLKHPEPENVTVEQKKLKEVDGWKSAERDSKDKRRERDGDAEAERAEKRSRINEKESEEGCIEGEGAVEREKEVFNYGVQQRKRMLRPRGSPQMTNRFRSRAQDNEGSQGKSEVSSVIYKVGECMQELIKLWKEYESSHSDKSGDFANNGPTLEVRIPAEHVTATNRQVRGGQLWGTDIYTDDSDLVAVLMHTGYCRPTASPPPSTIQELRATIRVLPSQDCYRSKLRNNVRSRAWGAGIGCSYRVERCYIVKKGGGTIELEPCLTHSSTVEPTLAPMAVERSMTTRAAASNALRQQRFVREVTIQYNLCNEPWIKYSISIVADKGLKKPLFTSSRLKKGEVLYLETHSCRYELCFAGEKTMKAVQASHSHETETEKSMNHHPHQQNGDKTDADNTLIDVFRWSRCKKPLPQKVMRSIGVPLPSDHIEVLEENLDWEDVQWSQTGVWIAGKEYTLARVHFLSPN